MTAPFNQQRYNPKRLHKGVDYGTYQKKLKQYPILKGVVKRVIPIELAGNQRGLLVDIIFDQIGKGIIHQHMDSVLVKAGQVVDRNTVLGTTGKTGQYLSGERVSTGIHAHIEVYDLKTGVTEDFEKLVIPEEDEDDMKVYENINELTGDWKEAVEWALKTKIIQGNGKTMGLRESEVKALVFQYRDNKRKGTL
jgi:murein DD-endopeptidase MepM/ murein hydrolase activator NlpD